MKEPPPSLFAFGFVSFLLGGMFLVASCAETHLGVWAVCLVLPSWLRTSLNWLGLAVGWLGIGLMTVGAILNVVSVVKRALRGIRRP